MLIDVFVKRTALINNGWILIVNRSFKLSVTCIVSCRIVMIAGKHNTRVYREIVRHINFEKYRIASHQLDQQYHPRLKQDQNHATLLKLVLYSQFC